MYKCNTCKDTGLKSLTTFWSMKHDSYTCDFCQCEKGQEKINLWLDMPETKAWYERVQKSKIDEAIRDSGIPQKFLERTFDGVDKTIVSQIAKAIWTDSWLYLYWPTWTWKTHAICCAAKMCIKELIPVMLVNFGEAMEKVRETFSDDCKDKWYFNRLKNIDVLILDDLGTEKHTEWIEQQLFTLVNYRYERDLPIYITSNFSLWELKYNPRIISRLYENSLQINFSGQKNFRINK